MFKHSLTSCITPTLEADYFILCSDDKKKKKASRDPLKPPHVARKQTLFTAKDDTFYIPAIKVERSNKYLPTWWHQI